MSRVLPLHRGAMGRGGMPMSIPPVKTGAQSTARQPADWRDFFALTKPRVMTLVIFTGLFLAALRAAGMIWRQGSLWMRMERIGTFIIRSGREGKLLEYPGREDKRNILRLGPWLFLGYCIWLAGRYL